MLIEQCERLGTDKDVLRLLAQLMRHPLEWGGTFKTINKGISRGSPMSPLFAAISVCAIHGRLDYSHYQSSQTSQRHSLSESGIKPAKSNKTSQ